MANQELDQDLRNRDKQTDRSEGRQPDNGIDLTQFEEFRNYQSSIDKNMAAKDAQIQRLSAQLQQTEQLIGRYQSQVDELSMRDMDDLERAQYEASKLREQVDWMYRQQEEQRENAIRAQHMSDIMEKTGVPLEVIADPNLMLHEAWRLAIDWQAANQGQQQETEQQRRAANATVLGGPARNPSPAGDLQRRYEEAIREARGEDMLNVMYEADRAGVTLYPPKD